MDDSKRNLKGSEKRDNWKRKHKDLPKEFWAADLDFVWIEKSPPGVVAYVDYKADNDSVTFTEAIMYNQFTSTAPVYIVQGDDETGCFKVRRFLSADWHPNPPVVQFEEVTTTTSWDEFATWQRDLRRKYKGRQEWLKLLRKVR